MIFCPKCSNLVANDSLICNHCSYIFPEPQRPVGITILAVLSLVGGVFGIIGAFTKNDTNSILIGSHVSPVLATVVSLIIALANILCGYGFLKQIRLSWSIYLILSVFGFINTLLLATMIDPMTISGSQLSGSGVAVLPFMHTIMKLMYISILLLNVFIIIYVFRKKKYFFRRLY